MGLWSFRGGFGFLAVLMLMLLVVSGSSCVFAVDGTEGDARAAIAEAENRVADCYGAVAGAEGAGANVTGLLNALDEAGMLLSRGILAYNVGDFGSARDFAVWCSGNLTGVVDEAHVLKETAILERYWDFMVNVVGSAVGSVAIVCGGFAVWFLLKKREETGRVA
jgi:hypothetical protein